MLPLEAQEKLTVEPFNNTVSEKIKDNQIIRFIEGVLDHPLVISYWCLLNYAPVSGLFMNLYFQTKGIPEETLKYYRANAVLGVFGQRGFDALIEHFAPDLSFEELERRKLTGSLPSSQRPSLRLRSIFREKTPVLDNEHQESLLTFSALESSKALVNPLKACWQDSPKEDQLGKRIWALQHIGDTFLNPRNRRITEAAWDRCAILDQMGEQFETAFGRRRNPHISCGEMIFSLKVIRASLAKEEAPRALKAMFDFFKQSIIGIARYIDKESKDPIYPGIMPQKMLEEEMVEAAWGLISVANRRALTGTNGAEEKEIENARMTLAKIITPDSSSSFSDSLKKTIMILNLAEESRIPFFSESWLKSHFGSGQFKPVFVKKINEAGEVTLKLDSDLILFRSGSQKASLQDYPLFAALALRFPYQPEIKIVDENDITWALNAEAVRQQFFQDSPPKTDISVNSFISLEGEFQPREYRPIEAKRISAQS